MAGRTASSELRLTGDDVGMERSCSKPVHLAHGQTDVSVGKRQKVASVRFTQFLNCVCKNYTTWPILISRSSLEEI